MVLTTAFLHFCALFVAAQAAPTEECYLPLDVMFVQDTTGSFTEDLVNVVQQIPDMLADISSTHPHSRFGVAEFHDKPFHPLGEEGDFCYLLGLSLSDDAEHFRAAYAKLGAFGGRDGPEASYHALINALEDEEVQWRPLAADRSKPFDPSYAGARVVILSTDAAPHLPNDYRKYSPPQYPGMPSYLPPYSGSPHPIQNDNIDWQCTAQDYPSPDQVRTAYLNHSAHLVILTPEDPAITGAWQWVNRDLFQQPDGFYQYIKADSSNLLEGVLRALDAVTATACATTTSAPETSAIASLTSAHSDNKGSSDVTRRVEDDVNIITFPVSRAASTTTLVTTAQVNLAADTTLPSPASTIADTSAVMMSSADAETTATEGLTTNGLTSPAVSDTSLQEGFASAGVVTASSDEALTNLSSEVFTEDILSSEDDCCPHLEIKLMKKPKQWKMMVVN